MQRKMLGVRLATFGLAFLHLFPAKKHVALFVASPSLGDAWKGFGAAVAGALYLLPPTTQARALGWLWSRRRWTLRALGVALAIAHVQPAREYLPKLLEAVTWSDAWRGLGAAAAVAWFVLDVRLQARVLSRLRAIAIPAPRPAWALRVAIAALVVTALALAACATGPLGDRGGGGDTGGSGGAGAACKPCLQDSDCGSGVCAQFDGDMFCAAACPNGDECGADETCSTTTTAAGDQTSACLPKAGTCGTGVGGNGGSGGGGGAGGGGAGGSGGCGGAAAPSTTTCGSLVAPSETAPCSSCGGSSSQKCQPNGCYGGWWCDTTTKKCHAPPTPSSCPAPPSSACADGGGASGTGSVVVPSGPISGSVNASGGTVSQLFFAVVGDTRPPVINDTSAYPSAVISKIYSDIAATSPQPEFVVSTGDYIFATANGGPSSSQFDLYLAARSKYSGVQFPAMGNHECTGAAASNCGAGAADGVTTNFSDFMSKMLAPIGQKQPYYEIDVNGTNGSWTAKLLFVAANAWDSTQASWLDAAMSKPTTYTFVVRHEPAAAASPGTSASEQIMRSHPYTLALVGHTHTYGKTGTRQVTIGNGGAPLVGSGNYGYGLVQQRTDGAIQVDMIDYQTGQADTSFRFALKADGSPAP